MWCSGSRRVPLARGGTIGRLLVFLPPKSPIIGRLALYLADGTTAGTLSGMPFEACSSRTGRDECSDVGDLIELVGWRPAWHADAACREAPDGVSWFPTDGQAATTARAVCARCLAKDDCASWALEQGPDLKGIWAGRSERQRRRDKRAGAAARAAQSSAMSTEPASDMVEKAEKFDPEPGRAEIRRTRSAGHRRSPGGARPGGRTRTCPASGPEGEGPQGQRSAPVRRPRRRRSGRARGCGQSLAGGLSGSSGEGSKPAHPSRKTGPRGSGRGPREAPRPPRPGRCGALRGSPAAPTAH